ncbi:hypothetical protein GAB14E_3611 [Colwellia psychrerythraea]|uniref:NERD domain-containing protein n=1 Tax=Colwellia psychrerythraea TaxID=28229 RepID=A0A099KJS8_COLPS|nr:hypothetical protein GAB14E_3611 [Colwellia psychrerythraea]
MNSIMHSTANKSLELDLVVMDNVYITAWRSDKMNGKII